VNTCDPKSERLPLRVKACFCCKTV